MQPLSLKTRRLYLYSLVTIFVVAVPFLILFSLGYRFDGRQFSLVSTGGLYIATDIAGASIYIEEEQVRETGTFRRAFFIQNLAPGLTHVHVQKEGYHAWTKELNVSAHIVTEAATFLLPLRPVTRDIPPFIPVPREDPDTATATPVTPTVNSEYLSVLDLFGFTATTTSATRTAPLELIVTEAPEPEPELSGAQLSLAAEVATTTVERRGVTIRETGRGLVAEWTRTGEEPPYFFCTTRDVCGPVVPIDTDGEAVGHFDFFPGRNDLVIVARESGIFATEIDSRGWQNTQPIYEAEDVDFRIGERGAIFIKEGDTVFEVII